MTNITKGNFFSSIRASLYQTQDLDDIEVRDEDSENHLYQEVLDHIFIDYMSLGEPPSSRLREFVKIDNVTPVTLRYVTANLQSVLKTTEVKLYNKGEYVEAIVYYDDNTAINELLAQFKPDNIPLIDDHAFDWYFNNRNLEFDFILKYIFHQLGSYCLEHELKFNDLFTVKGSIPIEVNTYINAPNLSAIIQHFQFPDARQVSITRNNELTDDDEGNKTTLQFNFSYKPVSAITTLALHSAKTIQQ